MIRLIDGSTANVALGIPDAALEVPAPHYRIPPSHNTAWVLFGGTDAANENFTYNAVGWRWVLGGTQGETGVSGCYVPFLLSTGTVTLGANTYAIDTLGATGNLWADTITVSSTQFARVATATEDDAQCLLELDVQGFRYLTVKVKRGTCASMDVFVTSLKKQIVGI